MAKIRIQGWPHFRGPDWREFTVDNLIPSSLTLEQCLHGVMKTAKPGVPSAEYGRESKGVLHHTLNIEVPSSHPQAT